MGFLKIDGKPEPIIKYFPGIEIFLYDIDPDSELLSGDVFNFNGEEVQLNIKDDKQLLNGLKNVIKSTRNEAHTEIYIFKLGELRGVTADFSPIEERVNDELELIIAKLRTEPIIEL